MWIKMKSLQNDNSKASRRTLQKTNSGPVRPFRTVLEWNLYPCGENLSLRTQGRRYLIIKNYNVIQNGTFILYQLNESTKTSCYCFPLKCFNSLYFIVEPCIDTISINSNQLMHISVFIKNTLKVYLKFLLPRHF